MVESIPRISGRPDLMEEIADDAPCMSTDDTYENGDDLSRTAVNFEITRASFSQSLWCMLTETMISPTLNGVVTVATESGCLDQFSHGPM